jgi:hypothetical protein
MRPEDLSDERLDEALRRQPRWEPPRHFVRAVIARMPAAAPVVPSPGPRGLSVAFRAALVGACAASVALAAGVLLSWATLALLPNVPIVATAYEMLLEGATLALVDNATIVAWVIAAVMLSITASVTGVAGEWI